MLRTSILDYHLPPELIATSPAEPRDSARLMVTSRADPGAIRHTHVRDLPDILRPGDCLVLNSTRVLPARFHGRRIGTGGKIEGLFLHEAPARRWVTLLRGRHLRTGAELELFDQRGEPSGFSLALLDRPGHEPGAWLVEVHGPESPTHAILSAVGSTPLPPYIVKARRGAHLEGEQPGDRERYQTVYAQQAGSVAAPTAGLHFTPELLSKLASRGIERVDVVLHVGVGTFKPVETEHVEEHPMHAEWCSMNAAAIDAVTRARAEGRRIIAVGTTAARTLESYALAPDRPGSMETRILITPGHRFRWVDGLLTNFHLPRSTLLAMVGALFADGVPPLLELYQRAIEERYRFYSYGDAMLVV